MMTAKEYIEGKVKSYTRLAERCPKRNTRRVIPAIPPSYITTMVREFIRGGEYLCKKN